jgi:hypothetical protein
MSPGGFPRYSQSTGGPRAVDERLVDAVNALQRLFERRRGTVGGHQELAEGAGLEVLDGRNVFKAMNNRYLEKTK